MSRVDIMHFTTRCPAWFRKLVGYYRWDQAEWDWLREFGRGKHWIRLK